MLVVYCPNVRQVYLVSSLGTSMIIMYPGMCQAQKKWVYNKLRIKDTLVLLGPIILVLLMAWGEMTFQWLLMIKS